MTELVGQEIVELVRGVCHPVSIFLYGSRARGDHLDESDYEIGVALKEAASISRATLANQFAGTNVHAYGRDLDPPTDHDP